MASDAQPVEVDGDVAHRATAMAVGIVLAICGVAILVSIGVGIAAVFGAFG